ncbi:MAG: hypothetical protein U0790_13205 [Isosphaeraceae bacterium]
MPRSILCQNCGVVLNLPQAVAVGKRMKCPKCGYRFVVSEKDASSELTAPGVADATSLTSADLARRPSHDDLPVPVGDHDLREMFDLPTGTAEEIERSAVPGKAAPLSDAAALFQDDPAGRRKPKGAEARSKARRCAQCGGLVPQGMSICAACGTDQDTGMRVDLDDDIAPTPVAAPSGPPLHITIVGLLCGLAAVALLIVALVQSARGEPGPVQYGWLCLAVVSGFGIYAAVQFYLGKSAKTLILALTLGAFVNFFSLIVLPIVEANTQAPDRVISKVEVKDDDPDALDSEGVEIKPISARIDQQKITSGLVVIGIYVLLCIYLLSPPVKRYFARQAFFAGASVPLS